MVFLFESHYNLVTITNSYCSVIAYHLYYRIHLFWTQYPPNIDDIHPTGTSYVLFTCYYLTLLTTFFYVH